MPLRGFFAEDVREKVLSLVIGGLIAATFAWLGVDAARDLRRFGDEPLACNLEGAAVAGSTGRQWVTVSGAAWRCRELLTNVPGGAAFVPASERDALVVARFDHDIACEREVERPFTGIVEPMDAGRAKDLRDAGLAIPPGARLFTLDVCDFCGKQNARIGVVVCAAFVLVGLGLYPIRRAIRSLWAKSHSTLQDAIHAPSSETAADRTVRLWGATVVALGVVAFMFLRGWVVWGFVPLPAVGVVGVLVGVWMVSSPASYRRVSSRARRR